MYTVQVLANAISAHMDPRSWKDPETFRPERFLGEDQTIIGSEGVIPFGLGKIYRISIYQFRLS